MTTPRGDNGRSLDNNPALLIVEQGPIRGRIGSPVSRGRNAEGRPIAAYRVADGWYTVEIDREALRAMVIAAVTSRGSKCKDGPVTVRFRGELRTRWDEEEAAARPVAREGA